MQRMSEDGNYRWGNELVRIEADMLNCILAAFDSVQDVYFLLKKRCK